MKVYHADEVGGEITEVDIPDDQFAVVTNLLNNKYVHIAGRVLDVLYSVTVGLEPGQDATTNIVAEMTPPDYETLVVKGEWGDRPKTFILAAGPGGRAAVEAWLKEELGEGDDE